MTEDDCLRAFTVTETARRLHLTTPAAHEAIAHGLIWAVFIGRATRVPAYEVERVKGNAARRQRLGIEHRRSAH